jgi:oligosaccharide repeat unit polymerase
MTYDPYIPAVAAGDALAQQARDAGARVKLAPLAFLPALLACGVSWLAGGVAELTDAGFILFTLVCVVFVVKELADFPRRFGVAGLLVYGGSLVWFCHDYIGNWLGADFGAAPFPPVVIAKVATLHVLFVMMMGFGLLIPWGRKVERLILAVPEAPSGGVYLLLCIVMFVIGMLPYALFTNQPFLVVVWKSLTTMRSETMDVWTVGRDGNLNFSWGGYVAQWIELGSVGAVFAGAYAVLAARRMFDKVICWAIWGLHTAMAFGSGTRGQIIFMIVPVIGLMYIKHQAFAAALFRRFSWKAYVLTGALFVGMLVLVQAQGQWRNSRTWQRDFEQVELFKVSGNHMFSEGLLGYALIPESRGFFYDRVPGEAIVRPIPDFFINMLIHPIPRALWPNKPVDPLFEWYNKTYLRQQQGLKGTTIARGLVGSWYFRYGMAGVIEGGLFMGWLMVVMERALRQSRGRMMAMLTCLGLLTWLFRCFRDVSFIELYSFVIGLALLIVMIKLSKLFVQPEAPEQGGGELAYA